MFFYSKDVQFVLTDQEFEAFIKETERVERVYIPRLKAFLSGMFIWAGEKPQEVDNNRRQIDGGRGWAVRKFGAWYDEYSGAKLDMSYYGYLNEPVKDEEVLSLEDYKKKLIQ